jgi:uncharacterized protein
MILTAYVKPGSREESFEKVDETTVKISVRARAINGEANKAVIELISKKYKIPKSLIEIKNGKNSKIKQIILQT